MQLLNFTCTEMIPGPRNDVQSEKWDLFENAATYSSARSISEINKKQDTGSVHAEKSSNKTILLE